VLVCIGLVIYDAYRTVDGIIVARAGKNEDMPFGWAIVFLAVAVFIASPSTSDITSAIRELRDEVREIKHELRMRR